MKPSANQWRGLLIGGLLAADLFAERIYVQLDIGEAQPATLQILPWCVVGLAAAVTIRSRGRNLAPLRLRTFLMVWGPLLFLAALLPVVGVVTGQYPPRGLAAVRVPLLAISAVLLGAEVRATDGRGLQAWAWPLLIGAVAQTAYALLQQLTVGHLLPSGPWDQLHVWDISIQQAYGRGIVVGRSSGFYTNPTILGVWAGIALLIALVAASGTVRVAIVGCSLTALVLAQSRGASLALLVSLIFALVLALRQRRLPRVRSLLPFAAAAALVIVVWLVLAAAGAPVATLPDRIGQTVRLLLGGTDPNLIGRFSFWSNGLPLLRDHPFGTFGPPELLLGSATDSEWVRALLQGGLPLFTSLVVALCGGVFVGRGGRPGGTALAYLSVFLIVAGLTQIPLEYPPAILYWAFVGVAIVDLRADTNDMDTAPGGQPDEPRAGQHQPRLLMVATIARTLETFMPPHAAALRARGWRVDGMAHAISDSPTAAAMFGQTWEIGWSRRPLSLGNLRAVPRVREVVARGGYDIVHVHTPIAAFVTRFALRDRSPARPAVIYTAHGFHFHGRAGFLRNLLYGSLERLGGKWTDELVVVNSEDLEAAARLHLLPAERIHRVPGVGLDLSFYDPSAVAEADVGGLRHELGLAPASAIVVTVAELTSNKNVAYVVSGVARMDQAAAHLVILGDGPQRAAIERTVERLGIAHRVHFVRRIADVRPLLRAAAVFTLVSFREGLPSSMIEAMAMRVPVVGTDTRGIRDLIGEDRGLLVPFDDPTALGAALDRLITDRTAALEMADRARAFVAAELAMDRVLLAYKKIYDTALARKA